MKNTPLIYPFGSLEYKTLRRFQTFVKLLAFTTPMLFLFCKTENKQSQTLALTSTITAVQDTTIKIEQRTPSTQQPDGMLLVKGGYTFIGSDSSGLFVENPRFWIYVQSFYMDISPVTVAQFRQFVNAASYKTEAENFGNGGFFQGNPSGIDEISKNTWILKDGCTWQYPNGKDYPAAADNLPVTQVSWNDAQVYAKWADKRLPHELEYEHAARNARNDQTLYSIGNSLKTPDGKWRVNIWQGTFPFKNYLEDGYKFASPVGIFGKTPLGLTDMTGNVWQWCSNGKFSYADVVKAITVGGKVAELAAEKAQRGGSFLCEATWCHGYRVSGRSFTSPKTSLLHVGFRCVKD